MHYKKNWPTYFMLFVRFALLVTCSEPIVLHKTMLFGVFCWVTMNSRDGYWAALVFWCCLINDKLSLHVMKITYQKTYLLYCCTLLVLWWTINSFKFIFIIFGKKTENLLSLWNGVPSLMTSVWTSLTISLQPSVCCSPSIQYSVVHRNGS